MTSKASRLMDTSEAADYLGFSVPTLKRWRGQDYGPPFIRRGQRQIRYRKEDLDQWLEDDSTEQISTKQA